MSLTMDLPNIAVNTPQWLALLTTGVGAVEGAILARNSGRTKSVQMDVVGVLVLALFLGLGGGLARDILLGNTPMVALRTPWYLVVVVASAALVISLGRFIPSTQSQAFVLLDSLTLGLYAAVGVQLALDFNVPWLGAVLVGLFASLTGGVIVSLLRRETPQLLLAGSPYAALAFLGIVVYLLVAPFSGGLASLACVSVVVIARFMVVRLNIQTKGTAPIERKVW
jgi:uncharacterized membrane protein YeiH